MEGGGVQFGEFVDARAEFLLDVADAVIVLGTGFGMFGKWTYNRAGLPRSWLVLLCMRFMVLASYESGMLLRLKPYRYSVIFNCC